MLRCLSQLDGWKKFNTIGAGTPHGDYRPPLASWLGTAPSMCYFPVCQGGPRIAAGLGYLTITLWPWPAGQGWGERGAARHYLFHVCLFIWMLIF